MKQKQKSEKVQGAQGFETYYGSVFAERWESLRASLLSEGIHAQLNFGHAEPYFLDPASVCAALCLPVHGGGKVLDLCAAPGGKTLVLSGNLDDDASLFSNVRSPERKARLQNVVRQVLPASISERVTVSCSDGATWCRRESESFDRILLDAPCSSERHVLADRKYLDIWTPSRIKSLAMEQWALLSSAWRLLAPGGFLLYATCALAPLENDEVLSRLKKKFNEVIFVPMQRMQEIALENSSTFSGSILLPGTLSVQELFSCAEQTSFGMRMLPDTAHGTGPLFFSLVQKPII